MACPQLVPNSEMRISGNSYLKYILDRYFMKVVEGQLIEALLEGRLMVDPPSLGYGVTRS
jgi:hypothetical protein